MKKSYYPSEEAIQRAAMQNFDRDVRMDLEEGTWDQTPDDVKSVYLDEAREILTTTGENYVPDFKDHDHICVIAV